MKTSLVKAKLEAELPRLQYRKGLYRTYGCIQMFDTELADGQLMELETPEYL